MTEYEQDLKIDLHRLHENWQDQSILYDKWGRKWSDAVRIKSRIEERKKTVKAELSYKFRRENPSNYGLDKWTETSIDDLIRIDETFKKVTEELVEAQWQENILEVAKRAFEHRREALGGEARLFVSNYFSVPNSPMEVTNVMKKMLDEEEKQRREEHLQYLRESPTLKKRMQKIG